MIRGLARVDATEGSEQSVTAAGMRWVFVAIVGLSVACGEDGAQARGAGPLVEIDAWSLTAGLDDPFWSSHGGDDAARCSGVHWRTEGLGVEVDTQACNYVTLTQTSVQPIAAGQRVQVRAWWQILASVEPTEGYIAVLIGDWLLFDERVAIPGDADARTVRIESPRAYPAGTPIYFHVDNHGYNSWTLGSLTVLADGGSSNE